MIDCSRTENFIKEKERLCQYYTDMGCTFCVLDRNIPGLSCSDFIAQYPKKAIEVVQKWSDENPPKTLLAEFLEHYPKTELNSNGCPNIAPCELGIIKLKDECKDKAVYCFHCKKCWNTLVNDEEDEKD